MSGPSGITRRCLVEEAWRARHLGGAAEGIVLHGVEREYGVRAARELQRTIDAMESELRERLDAIGSSLGWPSPAELYYRVGWQTDWGEG